MTFADLTEDEAILFAALAKVVIRADASFSPNEFEYMQAVVDAMGAERFNACLEQAKTRYPDRAAAIAASEIVVDPEKRRFLYDRLLDIAMTDDLHEQEALVLDGIAERWGIEQE